MLNTVDFTGGKRTFLTVRTIPSLQPFPTAMARAKTPTPQREPISPGGLFWALGYPLTPSFVVFLHP